MDPSLKRNIFPMFDWTNFLKEAKIEFLKLYELISSKKYNRDSFEFLRTLGRGAFGRVYLATLAGENEDHDVYYAIKVLEKAVVVKSKQIKQAINEKRILQALNFPFCVYLEYSFQDNSYLYLCLPFIVCGEMFKHLTKQKRFPEPLAKFYAAQVLLAFEYLHYCDLIFRDLKPENILIDDKGYLKITDFGFCKIVKTRTYTLCGTPEYLAPEVILQKGYGKSVDWWTFGILLYEMNAGRTPFRASDPMKIYEKAVKGKYSTPDYFSYELKDLIKNIVQVDITKRYGILKNGVNDIKDHPWFMDMNWDALFNGHIEPPYLPDVKGAGDTSHFDRYHEATWNIAKVDRYAKEFQDF
ncbi:unnamed protein product [Nezara viridula]|uniref:Uncharacterized protein n=1 Tax=Nezara viridula TaxID=85310 RepID=A0A9P0H317_NEZVI|nr:unnamed protein product [Nezara viridula]